MNSYCDIAASDGSGSMKAYLGMPAGKPKAGMVVIQEILGVNKDIRAMTDAWAANGYAALAPDLFWRLKPGVELDADIPDEFQEGLDLMQKFNADKSVEDLAASIAALRSRGCAKVAIAWVGGWPFSAPPAPTAMPRSATTASVSTICWANDRTSVSRCCCISRRATNSRRPRPRPRSSLR